MLKEVNGKLDFEEGMNNEARMDELFESLMMRGEPFGSASLKVQIAPSDFDFMVKLSDVSASEYFELQPTRLGSDYGNLEVNSFRHRFLNITIINDELWDAYYNASVTAIMRARQYPHLYIDKSFRVMAFQFMIGKEDLLSKTKGVMAYKLLERVGDNFNHALGGHRE